jgi:hypothetical protein
MVEEPALPSPEQKTPNSAVDDLVAHWIAKSKSTFVRYWLLASDPEKYFDKYIAGQNRRELTRTIVHSFLVASAYTLLFSAILSNETLAKDMPAVLQGILTKPYLLYPILVIGSIPALLITLVIYRALGARRDDLIFIFFNMLTLYLVLIAITLIVSIITTALSVTFAWLIWNPSNDDLGPVWFKYGYMIFVGVPLFATYAIFYYVPMILIQKSIVRSTFFASAICISFGIVSLTTIAGGFLGIFGPPTPRTYSWEIPIKQRDSVLAKWNKSLNGAIDAFYGGNLPAAASEIAEAVKLRPEDAYTALWREVIGQRLNLPSQLSTVRGTSDTEDWPSPIVQMFLGQSTPDAVLTNALDPYPEEKRERVCQAYFFNGAWALRKGSKDEAARLFQLAANDCPEQTSFERRAALEELKMLGH